MPLITTLPTWVAVNAADDRSPTGFVDKRTKLPTYGGGLDVGDYFDLTEREANDLSDVNVGILHSGRYRRVQLNADADPGFTEIGMIGYMPLLLTPNVNIVTSADQGVAGRFVVFLNPITPGNYGFIQEMGVAMVAWSGNPANPGAAAYIQGNRMGSVPPPNAAPVGFLQQTTSAGEMGLVAVLLNFPVVQG
jgi:hypothetical protein